MMNLRMIALAAGALALLAVPHSLPAATYQWSVMDGEPNRRIYLWVPEDCQRLRGIVLVKKNMIETGLSDDLVVREACRRQRVGIIWVSEDRTARGFARSAFGADWGWPSGLSEADEKDYQRLSAALRTPGMTADEKTAAQARIDAWDRQLAAAAGPIFERIMHLMADESGYEEIARAPVLFLSHSMGGLLCWHAPYRIRDRVWGSIPFKTGVRGAPKDIPEADMHGVPVMYVNQVAIEGPTGRSEPNNSAIGQRKDTGNLVCQLYDWGGHHLDTTHELACLVAMFIDKAGRYRLCDEIPATGQPRLKDLRASDGWLATSVLEPQQHPMAPEPRYEGPKDRAYWFFDQEMATAVTGFELEHRKRTPQYITASSDGTPLVPLSGPFESITVPIATGIDDGWTFRLTALLLDTVPSTDPAKRLLTGHATSGKAVINLTGGDNWFKLDDETVRYRQYNRGSVGHGFVIAYHPGDADYARGCTPLNIWMPGASTKGKPQQLRFPAIADVPTGTKEVVLNATSDVPGQTVDYYVVSGPAELTGTNRTYTGNILRLTPIPPRTRFPVKVIVVAYQKGRLKEPLVQTAQEVVREFLIYDPRTGPPKPAYLAVPGSPIRIACGGVACPPFAVPDEANGMSIDGGTPGASTAAIDLATAADPAPLAVYQHQIYGSRIAILVGRLKPGARHLVRLHFAETFFGSSGARIFDVLVNGTPALTQLDVLKEAGGKNRALVKELSAESNDSGEVEIVLTTQNPGGKDNAVINAMEIRADTAR